MQYSLAGASIRPVEDFDTSIIGNDFELPSTTDTKHPVISHLPTLKILLYRVTLEVRYSHDSQLHGFSLEIDHDVDGIKYVVNYDYPNSSEDYIHRIGRTARSESTGTSYAFFTPSNSKQAKDLVAVLKEANQVINPKLFEMVSRGGSFGGGKQSRWGYGGGFKGRENTGPKYHTRFGGVKSNGY